MATRLGIYLAAYQRYEYGTREPRLRALCIISEIFNISIDYLVKGQKRSNEN